MFKFKYFSLFFILSLSMQCHAGLIENFDKLMSITHWGLLLSPGLLLSGSLLEQATIIDRNYPDASPELEKFLKNELRKNNTSEELLNSIKFKIHNRLAAIASTETDQPHIITITSAIQKAFNEGLFGNSESKNDQNDREEKFLNASIRHEVAHIEHKDLYKNMTALVLFPLAAHYIFKVSTYHIHNAVSPHLNSFIKSILKIPSVVVKLYIARALFVIYSKHKEYRADKKAAESITDKETLNIFSNKCLEGYNEYERKHKLNPKYRNNLLRFIYDEIYTPDLYHPNYLLRSEVFNNAAEKIVS